jgi:hypothetical protein
LEIPAAETVQPLWQLNLRASQLAEESSHPLIRNFKGDEFFLQYIGSPETLFFRFLAKPRSRSPKFENRRIENPPPKLYPLARAGASVFRCIGPLAAPCTPPCY